MYLEIIFLTNKLWHKELNFVYRIQTVLSGTKFILHNNINFPQYNLGLSVFVLYGTICQLFCLVYVGKIIIFLHCC